MNIHRRLLFSSAATLLVLSVFSETASAVRPTFEENPAFEAVLEGVCPFPFMVEPFQNKEIIKTFSDGRTITTGVWKFLLTNLDTGNSVILNISGPAFTTVNADGTTTLIRGGTSSEIIAVDGTLVPIVNAGKIVETFDEDGNLISVTLTGHQFPTCNF
jgi:hypothetical protein